MFVKVTGAKRASAGSSITHGSVEVVMYGARPLFDEMLSPWAARSSGDATARFFATDTSHCALAALYNALASSPNTEASVLALLKERLGDPDTGNLRLPAMIDKLDTWIPGGVIEVRKNPIKDEATHKTADLTLPCLLTTSRPG